MGRGVTHYFGLWHDPDGALAEYECQKDGNSDGLAMFAAVLHQTLYPTITCALWKA